MALPGGPPSSVQVPIMHSRSSGGPYIDAPDQYQAASRAVTKASQVSGVRRVGMGGLVRDRGWTSLERVAGAEGRVSAESLTGERLDPVPCERAQLLLDP